MNAPKKMLQRLVGDIKQTNDPVDFILKSRELTQKMKSKNFWIKLRDSIDLVLKYQGEVDTIEPNSKKQIDKRFKMVVEASKALLIEGPRLLVKQNLDENVKDYFLYLNHVERIWRDSKILYKDKSYSSSLFLSILCIEETGKLNTLWSELLLGENLPPPKPPKNVRSGKFYSHKQKHILAAFSGAIINNRIDRIFGVKNIIKFLNTVENGELESLRQETLYASVNLNGPILPNLAISKSDALFHLALSGELMAEVLGHFPKDHFRIIKYVEKFEIQNGIAV